MSILSTLLGRAPNREPSSTQTGDDPEATAAGERLSASGYDRLDAKQVTLGLRDRSQAELEEVEGYERSHQNRKPVLDKLRYMRQPEPLPGYDAMPLDELLAAIESTDMATVKKVRGYERKFANRAEVIETVARVHHARQAETPATPTPAYQPNGGASL
jgi:hypothetical protein